MLKPSASKFQGFGNASVNAIGTFLIEMTIYGEKYVTQVYVVPDSAMSHAMLLGKELTRKTDINIRGG